MKRIREIVGIRRGIVILFLSIFSVAFATYGFAYSDNFTLGLFGFTLALHLLATMRAIEAVVEDVRAHHYLSSAGDIWLRAEEFIRTATPKVNLLGTASVPKGVGFEAAVLKLAIGEKEEAEERPNYVRYMCFASPVESIASDQLHEINRIKYLDLGEYLKWYKRFFSRWQRRNQRKEGFNKRLAMEEWYCALMNLTGENATGPHLLVKRHPEFLPSDILVFEEVGVSTNSRAIIAFPESPEQLMTRGLYTENNILATAVSTNWQGFLAERENNEIATAKPT